MRLDHAAHPVRDPEATHRFYSEVLGLTLTNAFAGEALLLSYALPGGGSLVFSARRGLEAEAPASDWEHRHIGLTVASREELKRWRARLDDHGVRYRLVDDERLYFADPDGTVLELEVEAPSPADPDAVRTLKKWLDERG